MATTQDVSVGNFIRYNGELVQVIEWQHRTPGNLRAFYQGKMRRVKDGKSAENRFRSGEAVEIVRVEVKELAYLYADGDAFVCMDNETYDQITVAKFMFGEGAKFMKEGDTVTAMIINIDRKSRVINLSIKAKDSSDQQDAMSKLQGDAQSGTTNLGALLKAKMDNQG